MYATGLVEHRVGQCRTTQHRKGPEPGAQGQGAERHTAGGRTDQCPPAQVCADQGQPTRVLTRGHPTQGYPAQCQLTQGLTARRRAAERDGRDAEAAVAEIWKSRGYDILARRQRTQAGEIDLVVADDRMLVFIEVKSRSTFSDAAYAVLPRQQRRLLQAADIILAEHAEWHRPDMRFDIALVASGQIEHIEDAIRPN